MTDPHYRGPHAQSAPVPYPPPGQALQPYSPPAWNLPAGYAPGPAVVWNARPAFATVSAGGRLGAAVLDVLLMMVTFGIGWLIWSLISWGSGQTPGKQLLGHVVADANTGEAFGWGRMFLREFIIEGLLFWIPNMLTLGFFGLVDALMVFRSDARTLHDMMAGSIVRHR
jgi:uncharacterized RDD family membrane protein YckC